jgi:hypothetical protein
VLPCGLVAKADVSVRLAQVFAQEDLDFTLFFSSLQSLIGHPVRTLRLRRLHRPRRLQPHGHRQTQMLAA